MSVAGEILGLVGGSGSGKSVLLRTIIGLLPKRAGTIEVLGSRSRQCRAMRSCAQSNEDGAFFSSNGALFSSLTVRQNVEFPMREYLASLGAAHDEVAAAKLEMVGLSRDDGDKFPSELSGGMTKRVALGPRARA